MTEISWYVSDVHCRKAIGYLGAGLAAEGFLPPDFEQSELLEMWGKALEITMNPEEYSPIGPDPERAVEILNHG